MTFTSKQSHVFNNLFPTYTKQVPIISWALVLYIISLQTTVIAQDTCIVATEEISYLENFTIDYPIVHLNIQLALEDELVMYHFSESLDSVIRKAIYSPRREAWFTGEAYTLFGGSMMANFISLSQTELTNLFLARDVLITIDSLRQMQVYSISDYFGNQRYHNAAICDSVIFALYTEAEVEKMAPEVDYLKLDAYDLRTKRLSTIYKDSTIEFFTEAFVGFKNSFFIKDKFYLIQPFNYQLTEINLKSLEKKQRTPQLLSALSNDTELLFKEVVASDRLNHFNQSGLGLIKKFIPYRLQSSIPYEEGFILYIESPGGNNRKYFYLSTESEKEDFMLATDLNNLFSDSTFCPYSTTMFFDMQFMSPENSYGVVQYPKSQSYINCDPKERRRIRRDILMRKYPDEDLDVRLLRYNYSLR